MGSFTIRRLKPEDAEEIVACFRRVYGESYANELFYHPVRLAESLADGSTCSVGALDGHSKVLGHMAMTLTERNGTPELGNTVVDPMARGEGLAWQVGAELTRWCRERGFRGFIHYPTTNHHIMQRQAAKRGFETGLMLGYIPADTDGKVIGGSGLRQAATIVYEPIAEQSIGESVENRAYLASYFADEIRQMAENCRLPRVWRTPEARAAAASSVISVQHFPRRDLSRMTISIAGKDIHQQIAAFSEQPPACQQLDCDMADAGIEIAISAARQLGFVFCGWLPGFGQADVLRLQKLNRTITDLEPVLVNSMAQSLLRHIRLELGT
jgi:GNAT superfamily N-acetyltransferase